MLLLCPLWHLSVLQVTAQGTRTRVLMSRGDILMATLKAETVLWFIRRWFKQVLYLTLHVYLYRLLWECNSHQCCSAEIWMIFASSIIPYLFSAFTSSMEKVKSFCFYIYFFFLMHTVQQMIITWSSASSWFCKLQMLQKSGSSVVLVSTAKLIFFLYREKCSLFWHNISCFACNV